MGCLDGRVAIITGGGCGIGREYALTFALEGARVVVNDLGVTTEGSRSKGFAAQAVVDEINSFGGEAIANTDSVSDWQGAKRLVDSAIAHFGGLHCLVNNAGVLRGGALLDLDESAWDAVVDVHMKGTFCVTRHAAAYWRDMAKAGTPLRASVLCTVSVAGLTNTGASNYAAAKSGVAAFALTVAKELARYGVRVNAIAPIARTRMTVHRQGSIVRAPKDQNAFDRSDPSNVPPLAVYLSTTDCPYTGGVWHIWGGELALCEGWKVVDRIERDGRWTFDDLRRLVPQVVDGRLDGSDRLISEAQSALDFIGWKGPDD